MSGFESEDVGFRGFLGVVFGPHGFLEACQQAGIVDARSILSVLIKLRHGRYLLAGILQSPRS